VAQTNLPLLEEEKSNEASQLVLKVSQKLNPEDHAISVLLHPC
jgi:hypothetical protein